MPHRVLSRPGIDALDCRKAAVVRRKSGARLQELETVCGEALRQAMAVDPSIVMSTRMRSGSQKNIGHGTV